MAEYDGGVQRMSMCKEQRQEQQRESAWSHASVLWRVFIAPFPTRRSPGPASDPSSEGHQIVP